MKIDSFVISFQPHDFIRGTSELRVKIHASGKVFGYADAIDSEYAEQMEDDDFESVLERLFRKSRESFREMAKEFKDIEDKMHPVTKRLLKSRLKP